MITYGLGTYTVYTGSTQSDPKKPKAGINIPIDLSKEEYDKVWNAISKVKNTFRYTAIFSATTWNYDDLANTVNSYLQAFTQKDINFLGSRDITLNINKEVLNVLTSFRFYTDFIDKNLRDDFGNKSEMPANFEQYCSNEYDTNFSYRFINQLRNYAQHKGLVVSLVDFNKHLDKKDNRTVKNNLRIYTNRRELLDDKKFKKEVKAELVNQPDQIDLMEHLPKWMNSLARIHYQLMHDLIPTSLSYALFVIEQIYKLNYDKKDNSVVPILSTIDHPEDNTKGMLTPSFIPLPVEDAQNIIKYCKEHDLMND